MNNRRAIVLTTAVVIAAGIIVVMTLRGFASRSPAPVANAAAAPIDAPIAAAPADASPQAATETPPWAQAQATDAGPAPDAAADPQRAQQMQQLQQAVRGIMTEASRRSDATNDHLRKALDTLQEMNDPAVTSQVNLDAVRHNLEISIKMQDLAQELQQVMADPASPTRQQRLDATLQQFGRLQSQLRQDVRAPGATVDLPTFPTAAPAATPSDATP